MKKSNRPVYLKDIASIYFNTLPEKGLLDVKIGDSFYGTCTIKYLLLQYPNAVVTGICAYDKDYLGIVLDERSVYR